MADASIREQLGRHLEGFVSLPFLFVGSGLSRRYLGTENWRGLLRRFAGYLDKSFEYYLSSADGDLPKTAGLLAEDFHDKWWTGGEFVESRERNGELAVDRQSALKIEISAYFQGLEVDEPPSDELKRELEVLRLAVVDGVVTTNWDLLLESVFPEYRVFVGQEELLFSVPQGIAEIYKIHGCCTAPHSLVLTDSDYQAFGERNAYLASKLLTVFVEHPVIFLGYSLSDPNILETLGAIAACAGPERIEDLRDRLIFVVWDDEEHVGTFTRSNILIGRVQIPVIEVRTASFLPIYDVLCSLKRQFPPKLLRQLKERLYELVRTQEPKEKVYVRDIDEEVDADDIEIVLGVGVIADVADRGYRAFSRKDIAHDVVFGNSKQWQARKIVEDVLPELLKQSRYVPIFKYLRSAGHLNHDGSLVLHGLDHRLEEEAARTIDGLRARQYGRRREEEILEAGYGIADIEARFGIDEVLKYGVLVPEASLRVEELEEFLRRNFNLYDHADSVKRTNFRRLVCMYDILKYKVATVPESV